MTTEEALATTPRGFSFVTSSLDHAAARRALDILLWKLNHTESEVDSVSQAMTRLRTYPATFVIEDGAASPPDVDHPYGLIEWMFFRVDVCNPRE